MHRAYQHYSRKMRATHMLPLPLIHLRSFPTSPPLPLTSLSRSTPCLIFIEFANSVAKCIISDKAGVLCPNAKGILLDPSRELSRTWGLAGCRIRLPCSSTLSPLQDCQPECEKVGRTTRSGNEAKGFCGFDHNRTTLSINAVTASRSSSSYLSTKVDQNHSLLGYIQQ